MDVAGGTHGAPPRCVRPREVENPAYFASLAAEQRIFFLWRPLLPDSDDDMLLELAVAAQADYLVTHNVRDFSPAPAAFGLRIVTPGEFLRAYRASQTP